MKYSHILLVFCFLWSGTDAFSQKLTEKRVKKLFEESAVMQEHFVGFILQDESGKVVYSQNPDIHFVPASNTKLLTLYAAIHILTDSIPAIEYEISGDSLIVWGTGDPSFLNPKLDNGKVFDFLKQSAQEIYLANQPNLEYEPSFWRSDPSHFPIYANTMLVKADGSGFLSISPRAMAGFLRPDSSYSSKKFDIVRSKKESVLLYPLLPIPSDFDDKVPFPMSMEMSRFLLEDTLKRQVKIVERKKTKSLETLYSVPSDSLYKHMMLPSDNFIAEQLLILCSSVLGDTLDPKITIRYAKENLFEGINHPPIWEDGSGLSRYNLFTPRTILEILNRVETLVGSKQRLRNLLPAGGLSGTLKNAYELDNGEAFVWAKTGTLKNMHLQSGWIDTRKGQTYRFVFMNNNFVKPTEEVRKEMVRIMTHIHEKY
ncbi:D-alanyl-D-alanine carboxypeptidase/D-alanyl-D-alanine-endopeptidase (penicillin-binding protein 4) [Mongoliibacter ruber]|uniref:D-alanyl-D-alanine carboxypeptidase/D-alanyl-D-alanine-endopeptidase (Penicillin-binding protein 4) n=1 Tax=Mongoliibacter ruber TaxID=1750599 RepID=A0A2T0WKG6_9BACT|nr:D-alanyl-D-alanine carboxypeptidase/D-alanyl-D-alanine-endopeptidase (penicillin-binding protein 4) [Mongoliibacter ruber]